MKGALIRDLHVTELRSAAEHLLDSGGRMQMVYAWYPPGETPELRYVATPAELTNIRGVALQGDAGAAKPCDDLAAAGLV